MTSWATAIFPFENYAAEVDVVERVWRTRSVEDPTFISVAVPHGRWSSYEGTGRLAFSSEAQKLGNPFGNSERLRIRRRAIPCWRICANLPLACLVDRPLSYGRRPRHCLAGWPELGDTDVRQYQYLPPQAPHECLVVQDGLVEDAMVRSALEVPSEPSNGAFCALPA